MATERTNPSRSNPPQDDLPWVDTGRNAKRSLIIGGLCLVLFVVSMVVYRILGGV
jgi:hypothetical protein